MDASCVVQIENTERKIFIDSIFEETAPKQSLRCFYRVPQRLRKANKDAYVPIIVSIGPLHRGQRRLQAMEKHKLWYFQALISRLAKDESKLFKYDLVDQLVSVIEDSKAYGYDYYGMPPDEFVRMILLDSCFMFELFYRALFKGDKVVKDDEIFESALMLDSIKRDLLLVENQLPYFILKKMYEVAGLNLMKKASISFVELATNFTVGIPISFPDFRVEHVLGLVRNYHLMPTQNYRCNTQSTYSSRSIPCSSDLRDSGVIFKASKSYKGRLMITFSENGVLEIPAFRFDHNSEALFRNIIALEQSHKHYTHKFTSYALFLDYLINTEKDVKILSKEGIIENCLGSEEDLATAINRICTGVVIEDDYFYMELSNKVNQYRIRKMSKLNAKLKMSKWNAILMRDYFNSPWSIIKFIAATILIILTFLQTFYAMKD